MPLESVLSALRQLIFDEPSLPPACDERRAYLADRFTGLSDSELEDLTAIPPERLATYTHLVLSGERSVLRWAFPMTFAAIHADDDEAALAAVRNADLDLIRQLNQFRPWRGSRSEELAGNFEDFVRSDQFPRRNSWPGVVELANLERSELDVLYAEDVEHERLTSERLTELLRLEVGQLMDLPVVVPGYVGLRSYNRDLVALRLHWRKHRRLPETLPDQERARQHCVCSRRFDTLLPTWIRLADEEYMALKTLPQDRTIAVQDFANEYLTHHGEETEAEQQFEAFFELFQRCLQSGVFLLRRQPTMT